MTDNQNVSYRSIMRYASVRVADNNITFSIKSTMTASILFKMVHSWPGPGSRRSKPWLSKSDRYPVQMQNNGAVPQRTAIYRDNDIKMIIRRGSALKWRSDPKSPGFCHYLSNTGRHHARFSHISRRYDGFPHLRNIQVPWSSARKFRNWGIFYRNGLEIRHRIFLKTDT